MNKNKSVVLTGSTGLIGKEAIEPLKKSSFEVYSLTSKNCNLFDYKAIEKYFKEIKPEYLLHFAWITGGDYLTNLINNEYVSASMNMLNEFKKNGGKRVVMAGTCFEYDFRDEPIMECSQLNPNTLYAKCKTELYKKAEKFCEENEISFGWGRIFYVFGHKEKEGRLTQALISKLYSNKTVSISYGQLIRDYMYSKDIASAFVQFLESSVEGPVNICTGKGISLGDFARLIAKKMNKTDLLKIYENETDQPKRIIGNNSRLVKEVGYNNFNSYGESIDKILEDLS